MALPNCCDVRAHLLRLPEDLAWARSLPTRLFNSLESFPLKSAAFRLLAPFLRSNLRLSLNHPFTMVLSTGSDRHSIGFSRPHPTSEPWDNATSPARHSPGARRPSALDVAQHRGAPPRARTKCHQSSAAPGRARTCCAPRHSRARGCVCLDRLNVDDLIAMHDLFKETEDLRNLRRTLRALISVAGSLRDFPSSKIGGRPWQMSQLKAGRVAPRRVRSRERDRDMSHDLLR